MKRCVLLFPFLLSLLFACTNDKESKHHFDLYVISKEDSLSAERWKRKGMPPPPLVIYGDYNFVVDSQARVYMHRVSSFDMYDYGPIDPVDPPKVGLDTSNFRAIDQTDMQNFLTNLASHWNERNVLVIASSSDTVPSGLLYTLIDTLKSGSAVRRWQIRRITKEEATVLNKKSSRR